MESAVRHAINPILPIALVALISGCGAGSPSAPRLGGATIDVDQTGTNSQPADTANVQDAETLPEAEAPAQEAFQEAAEPENTDSETGSGNETVAENESADVAISEGPIACGPIDLAMRLQILDEINDLRATGRNCGTEWFPAVDPLSWDDALDIAAARHSDDMATHDIFSHTGTDGSSVGERATQSSYTWDRIGENIAAGQRSAQEAHEGWIESPGHCRNIMQADFENIALACTVNDDATYTRYWTQVLGRRR